MIPHKREERITRYRIALTGTSSTGKTTLSHAIAHNTRLDYQAVETRPVLLQHGYKTHGELIAAGAEANYKFQLALARQRSLLVNDYRSFVTDRTALDSYVYCLMDSAKSITEEQCAQFERLVFDSLMNYDLIVFMRPNAAQFTPDGVRNPNPYYHLMADFVYAGVLARFAQMHPAHRLPDFLSFGGIDEPVKLTTIEQVGRIYGAVDARQHSLGTVEQFKAICSQINDLSAIRYHELVTADCA